MNLTDGITSLPGIGSIMANKLAKLNIASVFDLLYHLPFRYEDRRLISPARGVQIGENVTVVGTLSPVKSVFTKNGKRLQTATLTDGSGTLPVIWFNQTFLSRVFTSASEVALFGKVEFFGRKPTLISPEYELVTSQDSIHLRRLVPIYPETAGLSSKWLRSKIYALLASLPLDDFLPESEGLLAWKQALYTIHFPNSLADVAVARHRLAFDELLLLQLAASLRKQQWAATQLAHSFTIDQAKVLQFLSRLPFTLTISQNQAIKDILSDLGQSRPMNRLLEGDVGSGKTIVAAVAAYLAYLNGYQTLLLAPTQILATQHNQTLSALFKPFGIDIGLVTGNSKKRIANSKIIVGTHALLSANFNNAGLVIIDEQHRFGMAQRAFAAVLSKAPHILTMTATPIPRTIALTMYGDLDLSTLTDMPSGRIPVKTWAIPESKRDAAYKWISSQISNLKSQIFIVCPFIEESETLTTVKAATAEFATLSQIFAGFKLGLLHGKLKAVQKDEVIAKFRAGEYHILVTTPLVEGGIDISAASIMVVEAADRFGLAQLHQLRGRVGRGGQAAYCLLFADQITPRP